MSTKLIINPDYRFKEQSESIISTFTESLSKLDINPIESLIEEDGLFDSSDKYSFLLLIMNIIDQEKKDGITNLYFKRGECHGCSVGHMTYEFYNDDELRFSFVFIQENDALSEIFMCNYSTGSEEPYDYTYRYEG